MSTTLNSLRKRAKYPVDLGDGDTVYVRALKDDETTGFMAVAGDIEKKNCFIGLCLVNEDGSQVFTRADGESYDDFGKRVYTELDGGIPQDTFLKLAQAVKKVSKDPDEETLRKNS